MPNSNNLNLGSVQETLLLPLWGRAMETQKKHPLLIDPQAVKIVNSISYDFSTIANRIHPVTRQAWIARSIFFDQVIKNFIAKNPDASIVNIGCGLDTTFDRVDNGTIQWFDLDMPDVITLRKQYFQETERRKMIASSVFDTAWHNVINNKGHVFLLIAGVLYYFTEQKIKELFAGFHKTFSGVEIVFDYSSHKGVEMANKKVIDDGGMKQTAHLQWAIDDIRDMKQWNTAITVLKAMPMFREHKKLFPIYKRLGFNIADRMKIMSLAHIRID